MKEERSTSLHISGRMGNTDTVPHSPSPLFFDSEGVKRLTETFREVGDHLSALNVLMANGIPIQVNVSIPEIPATINNIVLNPPELPIVVQPAAVQPQILVEPPFVRIEQPNIRVDAVAEPRIQVDNEINHPGPLFTRQELSAMMMAVLSLMCLIAVAMFILAYRHLSQ